MSSESTFQNGVGTLVNRANLEAAKGKMGVLAKYHDQLGNSRIGIVLVEMVGEKGADLVVALGQHYETAIKLDPKADRSRLRQVARDGLEGFLTASEVIGAGSPAFKDLYPEVFRNNLPGVAERLRDSLKLALDTVIPPPKLGWQAKFKDENPILYDAIKWLVPFVGGAIASPLILGLTNHLH